MSRPVVLFKTPRLKAPPSQMEEILSDTHAAFIIRTTDLTKSRAPQLMSATHDYKPCFQS